MSSTATETVSQNQKTCLQNSFRERTHRIPRPRVWPKHCFNGMWPQVPSPSPRLDEHALRGLMASSGALSRLSAHKVWNMAWLLLSCCWLPLPYRDRLFPCIFGRRRRRSLHKKCAFERAQERHEVSVLWTSTPDPRDRCILSCSKIQVPRGRLEAFWTLTARQVNPWYGIADTDNSMMHQDKLPAKLLLVWTVHLTTR